MAVDTERALKDDHREALRLVVETARQAIEQDFQIAERLDAKARGQVTISATWVAAVQAFAAIAINAAIANDNTHTWWFAGIIGLAFLQGVFFGTALFYCTRVWRLRDVDEISQQGLKQMRDTALADPDALATSLIEHYRAIMAQRRAANEKRVTNLKTSVLPWAIGMALGFCEVLTTLAFLSYL